MNAYFQFNLYDLIAELGEDEVKGILSSFRSIWENDVEQFLHKKAIEFSKQRLAATYLVFTKRKGQRELIGYYTLANKIIRIESKHLSGTQRRKIAKFASYDKDVKGYTLPAILIGQLGKNYSDDLNHEITGDELLKMACERISEIQMMLSGKVVYLECESTPRLQAFYQENGFSYFGERELEADEANDFRATSLLQMLKYL